MNIIGIMTCFNRKEQTINSIRELMLGNPDWNIYFVVVDDNSNDGTRDALNKIQNVMVLKGTGDLFYSGGMRKGISYVKDNVFSADYILFFNDDVDFYEGILDRMKNYSITGEEIVVGATESSNGNLSYGGVIAQSRFFPRFKQMMSDGDNIIYCDTFNANCVLIPYHVFIKLPNIDSVYIHSLGDYDYGLVASRNGVQIVVTNFFVGKCDDNQISSNWLDTSKRRRERLRQKESVKGLPVNIWFHFCYKNYGLCTAIVSTIWQYFKIVINK